MDEFGFLVNLVNSGEFKTALFFIAIGFAWKTYEYVINKRKAKSEADIEVSKAKSKADIEASQEIVTHYLKDDDTKTELVNEYIGNLKKSVESLKAEVKEMRDEAKKTESRHDIESRAFGAEIQGLKTWRAKDAATIKEQAKEIKTYKAIYQEHSKEIKALKTWKANIETILGPWLNIVIKEFQPEDIEKLNGAVGGFIDEIRKQHGTN